MGFIRPDNIQNIITVIGLWIFGRSITFSLTDALAKSAECPAAEASLPMLTLDHQCKKPILLTWERTTGTGPSYHPIHGRAVQVALREHGKVHHCPSHMKANRF